MCSLDQFHIRLNYKIELRSNSELRSDWMSSRPNQKKCGIKYVTLQSRFLIDTVSADTVKSKAFLIFKNFAIPWHLCYNNISHLEVVKKHLNWLFISYVWITSQNYKEPYYLFDFTQLIDIWIWKIVRL